MSENLAVCVHNDNQTVTPFETVDAIYKAGFKNVFVQYYRRENIDYDEIEVIKYCQKLGLNILFCHIGYKHINDIWLEGEEGDIVTQNYIEDLDLMKSLGIELVCMHLTTHRDPPMFNKLGIERIRKIVKHAEKIGMKIAFENTRIQGYLEYAFENIHSDNIGICFDAGHYHVHFKDEFNWEFFKDKFLGVHLHDNDQTFDQHLLPGEGTNNWKFIIPQLRKYGYKGPLTLEHCYKNDYLKMTLDDFYKKVYEAGKRLEELDK